MRTRKLTLGFTLVEVLVAMMIMSIVAMMAWQGVDGVIRTRDTSERRLEQVLRVNTVLAQWEQDLGAVQENGRVPPLLFDGSTMRLTRRTPTGMQLVVWSLRSGTWLRWAGPPVTTANDLQDSWMSSQQFLGNEPGQVRTLTGIDQLQLYYFRDNAWSNAQSSAGVATDPGAAAPSDPLPRGVRLVLTFAEGSGFAGTVTRDIAMAPQ